MATNFKSISIIDISPLLTNLDASRMAEDPGVSQVVKELDRACREAGFFYAKGHGIPDSMLKEVRKVTRAFFNLPLQEKKKIKMSPMTGFRGYQRIGENITKGTPDMHEAIDCYKEIKDGMYGNLGKPLVGSNQWPDYPVNFKSLMEEYIRLCTDLSRKIMKGIGIALGGRWDEFEGQRGGDPFWVMRLIGYPGLLGDNCANMTQNDIGCGAHTDYGLLTLVNQDDEFPALQVKNKSGEWIQAVPIPGTFVCNIGDMLEILSNGLYESTLHRVVNNFPMYRTSVAYFYEPNYDAAIEPLEICVEVTGGERRFGRAVYGEHLIRKVQSNFVM